MAMRDLTGMTLGKYQVVGRLGRGGMAEVYRAFQPGMERYVALKVMYPHLSGDEGFVERFRREARMVGALRHPHIVQVIDFDQHDNILYMVMEFIQGEPLNAVLSRRGRLPFEESVSITAKLADALDYAHREGVLHRDIKPSNVLFTKSGEPVLTDFGIARIVGDTHLTASGAVLGTPAYMSPEAGQGIQVDERADIYSLGVMFYEMLTGDVPFNADTPYAVIFKHIHAPLPMPRTVLPDLPESVEKALLKSLAKNVEERFSSAGALRDALYRAQQVMPTELATALGSPTPTSARRASGSESVPSTSLVKAGQGPTMLPEPEVPDQPRRSRNPLLAISVLVTLLIIALAVFFILRSLPSSGNGADGLVAASATAEATGAPLVAAVRGVTPTPSHTVTSAPSAVGPASVTPTASATQTVAPTATRTPTLTLTETVPPTASRTATVTEVRPTEVPTEVTPATRPAEAATEIAALPAPASDFDAEIDRLLSNGMYDEALAVTDEALRTDPESYHALATRARVLLLYREDADRLEEGRQLAEDLIAREPDQGEAYFALAMYHQYSPVNDAPTAIGYLDEAIARSYRPPHAYWERAEAARSLDEVPVEAVLADYGRAIELDPTFSKPYLRRSRAEFLTDIGRYEEAYRDFSAILTRNADPSYFPAAAPSYLLSGHGAEMLELYRRVLDESAGAEPGDEDVDPQFLAQAAYVAYFLGDADRARGWAEQALTLAPDTAGATYVLAMMRYWAGDSADALAYFDSITEVEPWTYDWPFLNDRFGHDLFLDRARALVAMGYTDVALWELIFARGRTDAALRLTEEMLAREPDSLEWQTLRAMVLVQYRDDERLEEGRAVAEAVLATDRLHGRANFVLGYYYRYAPYNDLASAAWHFGLAIRNGFQPAFAYLERGNTKRYLPDLPFESVLADFARALELEPDNLGALLSRGSYLTQLGRYDEAYRDYSRAHALAHDTYFHAEMGTAYLLSGHGARLLALYRHAIDGWELEDPFYLANGAYVAWYLGDTEQAQRWATRALELNPEQWSAVYLLALMAQQAGDSTAAMEDLDRVAAAEPWTYDWPFLYWVYDRHIDLDRARVMADLGRLDEAIALLRTRIEDGTLWWTGGPLEMARLLRIQGRYDEAQSWLMHAQETLGWIVGGQDYTGALEAEWQLLSESRAAAGE